MLCLLRGNDSGIPAVLEAVSATYHEVSCPYTRGSDAPC